MKESSDILKDQIREWLNHSSPASELETSAAEDALVLYAREYAQAPPPGLKQKILDKIKALEEAKRSPIILDLQHLPMLDASSSWYDWQKAVEGIHPPENFNGIHLHVLEAGKDRKLFVAWVKEYIEEEVHHDLLESFILLEGTCECHITDPEGNARIVRMGPGDYIEMGLGESHDVVITSLEPAKAILQWRRIA